MVFSCPGCRIGIGIGQGRTKEEKIDAYPFKVDHWGMWRLPQNCCQISKMRLQFPNKVGSIDKKQCNKSKDHIAQAHSSECEEQRHGQWNNKQKRAFVKLIEEPKQDERWEKPSLPLLDYPTKERKQEEHDKKGREVRCPDIATVCPGSHGCSIEQRCDRTRQSSIIAPGK